MVRALFTAIVAASVMATPPAAMAGSVLQLRYDDCARPVTHRPEPGVAYRPGIDVHGRPVAPADAGSTALPPENPEFIGVELAAPLTVVPGTGGKAARVTGDVPLGHVRVPVSGGPPTLDHRPLAAADREALSAACHGAGAPR